MKYIISEEELKGLVKAVFHSKNQIQTLYDWIAVFKSKTPVEKIAEGELEGSWLYEKHSSISQENFGEYLFEKYNKQKVRIYIEVIK